jgi:carbamoylphosphate synthase large subunit
VDVVWPVYDGELEPLAEASSRFEAEDVRLLMCDAATIGLCLDKAAFHERLAETGWVLPHRVVRSTDELRAAAEELGYPDIVLAVKPVRATGGRGFHVIAASYDPGARFFDARSDVTTCTLEVALDAMATRDAQASSAVLVTPHVDGDEYGCDVLADDGEAVAAVTRRKLPPIREGMHTRIVVDEDQRVSSMASDVVREIKADGLLSVDLREDADGSLRLLEINPRAGAYLGMACTKIDLFGLALAKLFGRALDVDAHRKASGVVMGVRYWADLVHIDGMPRVLGE